MRIPWHGKQQEQTRSAERMTAANFTHIHKFHTSFTGGSVKHAAAWTLDGHSRENHWSGNEPTVIGSTLVLRQSFNECFLSK